MSFNRETQEKINSAHCIRGIPLSEIMTPYPSIRSLLESQVRRYGDKTFILFHSKEGHGEAISYNQFFVYTSQAANFLKLKGIGYGDRVIFKTRNDLSTLIQFFAIWMIGGVSLPVSNKMELWIEPNVSSKILKIDNQFIKILKNQKPEFKIGKKSKLSDDVLIFNSFNQEGNGRGIVLSHYNVLVDAMAIADWHELTDNLSVLCWVPLNHVTGIIGCILSSLYAGCRIILMDSVRKENFLNLLLTEKVELVFINSSGLLNCEDSLKKLTDHEKTSIRHFICSHRNLTTQTIIRFLKKYKIRLFPGFELAEAACFSSFLPISLSNREFLDLLSIEKGLPIGTALLPAEMNVLDAEGIEIKEGEIGQIVIRGHHIMKGYLNNEEATVEVFKHGWLNSGSDGFYTIGSDGTRHFTVIR